ncbi:Alpha/Beta hydrolase protein [Dactylonectria estremocensis]|uniref:Alpha/Beta hydrolase protein n=1 Tax=Dactylonectria estremocensis TaxID=1079267 RepID=A0A9P9IDB9_9HYPO|nr:Alpha/Beta hydrolase protein [Dactylonectria estremocensis]
MTPEETQNFLRSLAAPLRNQIPTPLLHQPGEAGLKYEDVFFPSEDGISLEAWYVPRPGSNKLIIVNHPLRCNRAGFPAHLEPWKSFLGGSATGNDYELNFVPDLKILHDAGYNVLAYDMRNFGNSGQANGGISGTGHFESRDVIGSLNYVRSRQDTKNMTIGLFSRCLGGIATFIAVHRRPEVFKDVRCLLVPNPLSYRPFVEKALEMAGLEDHFDEVNKLVKIESSFNIDELSPIRIMKSIRIPTFIYSVRNDILTKASDVQTMYDSIPIEDKRLHWVDGTVRMKGYTYFQDNPQIFVEWLAQHMD